MVAPFVWTPGIGVDPVALARLRKQFRKPSHPMGEAWFMGDARRMFTELQGRVDDVPVSVLQKALTEIGSGTSAFGPMPEWDAWFHYLLASSVPRHQAMQVASLHAYMITAFMAIYPDGVRHEPYKGFERDALSTLGRCLMEKGLWSDASTARGPMTDVRLAGCSDLSAAMFLCLKYLPATEVEGWLRSVLAIPSPHWRARLMIWMTGAHGVLIDELRWPSEFQEDGRPTLGWEWSHCLGPKAGGQGEGGRDSATFIPAASREVALAAALDYFTEDHYLTWLTSISSVPGLEDRLAEIPFLFEERYVRAQAATPSRDTPSPPAP